MKNCYSLFLSFFLLLSASLSAQCDTSYVQGLYPVNILFSPSNNLCPTQVINFQAVPSVGNQYQYSWNFGDPGSGAANTALTKNTSHWYPYNALPQSYTVTLVVIDTVGNDKCNFDTQIINIQAAQQILLDTSDFNLCVTGLNPATQSDTTITFYLLSPASGNFSWDFGDGTPPQVGTALNQTHTYMNFGTYTITVTEVGSNCPGFQKVFRWNTNPFTSFVFTTNPVMCEGDTVRMTNTTVPAGVADTYTWDWGDGTVYTVNDTTRQWHVYSFPINQYCTTNPGNGGTFPYNITLTGTNNCFSQPISTPVNIKPVAHVDFTFPAVICVNQTVTFTNTSCPTWGGNVFSWNFGDPGSGAANTLVTNSAFVNPTHVYTTPGVYTVTLIGNKTNGCPTPDTVVHQITVTDDPVININVTSTTVGCVPFLVTIDNNTTPNVGINYQWSVSPNQYYYYTNGTNANSAEPQIVFTQPGTYSLCVNAYNLCNSANYCITILVKDVPQVSLYGQNDVCVPVGDSASITPNIYYLYWQNGTVNNYNWVFTTGVPPTSTSPNPSGIMFPPGYNTIALTVTNECGSDYDAVGFTVTEIPEQTVSYVVSDTTGCITSGPLNVAFTSNYAPASASASWSVSPGSGWSYTVGNSSSANPTISFTQAGNYTVTHQVSNVCGTSTWQTNIAVKEPPVINLTPQPDVCLPAGSSQVSLTPSVSYTNNNAPITSYNWIFNGGVPSSYSGPYPGPIVYTPGAHTITVTAVNQCGSATASDNFVVVVSPNAGATFTGNGVPGQNNICLPVGGTFVINFFNTSTPNGVTYNWNLGGGAGIGFSAGSTTSANPQVTITQAGIYNITLTATNSCGSDAEVFPFTIMQGPQVTIDAVADDCGFSIVTPNATIVSNSGPITAYNWTFVGGNPGSSNLQFPPAITFAPGNDTIYLSVTNACGTSIDSEVLYVAPPPVLNVHVDTVICTNTGAITLWATPPGGTWSGANVTQTVTNAQGTYATFNPVVGAYNAIYTYGSGNCLTKDTTRVTVYAPPPVDAGINFDVCEGDPPYVLAPIGTPAGGYWTDSLGTVITAYNPTQDGNFWLYYHYTHPVTGCSNMDSVIIVVHPLPVIQIPATITYCLTTSSIILPPGLPTNGYWTGPPGTVSFGNLYNNTASGLGLDTLRYHYTTQFGCEDSATMLATIILPVNSNAGNDSLVCFNGTPLQLTGLPNGGVWYGNGVDSLGLFSPYSTAPGNQELIYTFGYGDCQTWDTMYVNVLPLPVNIPGTYYGCITDSFIMLNQSTPLGGTWVGNAVVDSTFYPQQSGLGVTNLLYIVTDNNNCTDTSATTVTITPLPIPLFLAPTYGCINTLIGFQNLSANAGHYLWDFKDGLTDTTTSPIHVFADTGTYFVTLIAYGQTPANCPDSIIIPITILDLPIADFDPIPDSACATIMGPNLVGIQVNFADSSFTYGGTYSWQFGDGQTSTNINPGTITYLEGLNDTMFVVSLAITNMCGSGTHQDTVKVMALPKAAFGTNVNVGCSPAPFFFSNVSQGNATSYSWIFGNGQTSTSPNPGVQYFTASTQDTTYTITLIAMNACGADTAYHSVLVHPNNVNAFFNANPTTGCAPLQVVVSNFSNGTNISYDFGDGSGSQAANTVHIYTQPGTYTLSQFADDGCSYDTATVTIVVSPTPQASFFTPAPTCVGNPIQFTLNTVGVNAVLYDFGDPSTIADTSNALNPVYTYPQAGTFGVTLTTYSTANGCPSTIIQNVVISPLPQIDFTVASVLECTPFSFQVLTNNSQGGFHFWDFGNGNTSASATPTNVYTTAGTYTVTYTNTDAIGCTKDSVFTITALPQPVSAFVPNTPYMCGAPASFTFTNQSTGNSLGYEWDFGNGQTNTTLNPSSTYIITDTFTVTLITTNNFGCKDTVSNNVIIHPQPQATANVSPLLGCAPLLVNASNTSSNITGQTWNWGDGSPTETTFNPNPHTYPVPNLYTVSLFTNYNNVCFDTFNVDVNVIPSPIAAFTPVISGNICDGPITVTMTNLSQFATNYVWDLGNATTSSAFEPTVTYTGVGTYTISLIASVGAGCSDTIIHTVTIHPSPIAGMQVIPTQGCTPLVVNASNLSTGAGQFVWTWGDGTPAETTLNPLPHTYLNDTTYTITLIANYNNFCYDTLQTIVTVAPEPVSDFTMNIVGDVCGGPVQVSTTNNSQYATNYVWNMGNGSQYSTLNVNNELYTTAGTFTITLIAINNFGCQDSFTQSFTLHPAPVASALVIPTQGCTPLTVTATNNSTGAGSYVWTWGDGTPAETSLNPLPHTYVNDTTYTVTLIANYQNTCYDTFQTTITIAPEPVADFTINIVGDICGGPVQVSTTNNSQYATNYVWNMGNGSQYSTATVSNENYATPGTFTVTLTAINNFGCQDSFTQSFTLHPNPIASAQIIPTQGCTPLTVNATNNSTVATQFVWTWGDGTPAETSLNPLPHTYVNDTTYTVTLIANYQNTCYDTFQTTITVLPVPLASFTLNITGDNCGGPLQVTTNNTSQFASNYVWTMGNGNQYNTVDVNNEVYSAADTFTVVLVSLNNTGCTDTARQSFILHPKPNAQALISPTAACPPVIVTVQNQSTNYTSLIWTFGDGSAAEMTTNPQPHTYFVPDTSYTMQLFLNYNGVCFDTLTQLIQTGLPPIASFTTDTTGDICGGPATLLFNNTSVNATNYFWNMGDGVQFSYDVNPSAIYDVPGPYFIQMIASNAYCKDTATTTYFLHPEVTSDLVADTTTGCSPLTIQFTSLAQNAQAYLWNFGDGQFSTMTNPLHVYDNPGYYSVTLIANIPGSICADTMAYVNYINVVQGPVAAFVYEQTDLVDPFNNVITFTNASNFATTYSWNFGDGATSLAESPMHTYGSNDSVWVNMYAWNDLGCVDTAMTQISLTPFGDLQVPNAFAPGSGVPGANVFLPVGIGLVEYEIAVYNIWGDLVWSANKLDDLGRPTQAWDGKDKNGKEINSDAFVWKVHKAKFKGNRQWSGMSYNRSGEKPERIGTVTILR